MNVTTNILQRAFQLQSENGMGTCFTIDVDNRQYLVTARHNVNTIVDCAEINIKHNKIWKILDVTLVGHCEGEIDISVLAAKRQLSPTHPINIGEDGVVLGQDLYFLGFPYGLTNEAGELNNNFPLPLVKKAIFSGMPRTSDDKLFLLDGHNNPGFSGGPVIFHPQNGTPNDISILGVISGYINRMMPIYLDDKESPLRFGYNTGIIRSYSITHAIDLISQNPIGFDLSTSANN